MATTLGDITRELTERILAPAKAEADLVLASAQKEAAAILEQAREEAAKIRNDAAAEAAKTTKQLHSDLEVAARNFITMTQEKLETAVVPPVVADEVRGALGDTDFLKGIIEKLLVEFAKAQGKESSLELLLPVHTQEEMGSWFIEKFREKMAGHLTVHFTDKISFGFLLGGTGDRNGHFNFGTGMVEVFSGFCSPRFRRYFFQDEE